MKNHKISFRPEAERDMFEATIYLAKDNIEISKMFRVALEHSLVILSDMPEIGSIRNFEDSELKGMRMCPIQKFEKYLIFYRHAKDGVEIIRILHGARDISKFFE